MLLENPRSRPTIYQVLREGCLMQGREVPIKDVSVASLASIVYNAELKEATTDLLESYET